VTASFDLSFEIIIFMNLSSDTHPYACKAALLLNDAVSDELHSSVGDHKGKIGHESSRETLGANRRNWYQDGEGLSELL
jgi:hypothetical protein